MELVHNKSGRWAPAQDVSLIADQSWVDCLDRSALLGCYCAAPGAERSGSLIAVWHGALGIDVLVRSIWASAGTQKAKEISARWVGARATNRSLDARWSSHLGPVYRPVAYQYPDIDQVIDIEVVGGGFRATFSTAGYVPPAGNSIVGRFGSSGFTPQAQLVPGSTDIVIPFRRADITVGSDLIQAVDIAGDPLLDRTTASRDFGITWASPLGRPLDQKIAWSKYSRSLSPDWGIVIPPGPTPPPDGEQIVVPFRRAYIVVNEALLVRADAAAVIHAAWLRINIDADSWLLSWSAEIPLDQLDAVMPSPDPVELIAYINGYEFRLLVRGRPGESKQFGKRSVQLEGDGVAAVLASPLADQAQHTNSTPATAQQLIISALEYTGFTVNWEAADWTVPAGALSVFGAPIDVALHVAGSIGAVLQADAASDSIRISPRYPVLPWAWATAEPDVVLPAGAVEFAGVECIDNQFFNAVFVSGVASGISANVKRAGQAADKPVSQPVTHSLITHVDAARQRGEAVLGGAGRKIMRRLRLPVLPETGVIQLGRLVQFTDGGVSYRGIVRANSISVEFPVIRQTITIEAEA